MSAQSEPQVCFFLSTYQPYGVQGERRLLEPRIAADLARPRDNSEPVVQIVGPAKPRDKHRDIGHAGHVHAPGAESSAVAALQKQLDELKALVAGLTSKASKKADA